MSKTRINNHKDQASNTNLFFNTQINLVNQYIKQAKQPGLFILRGQKDEALNIIDNNLELLSIIIPEITDDKHPSGRRYVGRTLYQLALGENDRELHEAIGKRIELKYGRDVLEKQFNDQFPNGIKSTINYRPFFDSLIETIAADPTIKFINNTNEMNAATTESLQTLHDMLTPKHIDACTTGVHFDLQIIIDFIEAYDANFDKFTNEDKKWDQRKLYWRCGFGLIENYIPNFIAMAINESNDFFGVMECKKNVTRPKGTGDSNFFDSNLGISHYKCAGMNVAADSGSPGWIAPPPVLKDFLKLTQTSLSCSKTVASTLSQLAAK